MTSLLRRVSMFAAVLLALALVPGSVEAQAALDSQADSSISLFGNQGYTLKQFRSGNIGATQNTEYSLAVPTGKTAVVVAVCDNNCTDLDLQIFGGGRSLGEDVAADDVPMVAIANHAGAMTVRVVMATCSTSSCGFRLMVFIK